MVADRPTLTSKEKSNQMIFLPSGVKWRQCRSKRAEEAVKERM